VRCSIQVVCMGGGFQLEESRSEIRNEIRNKQTSSATAGGCAGSCCLQGAELALAEASQVMLMAKPWSASHLSVFQVVDCGPNQSCTIQQLHADRFAGCWC